jgi:hypothetical protein
MARLVREDASNPRAALDLLEFPFQRIGRAQAATPFRVLQRVERARLSQRLLEVHGHGRE